MSKVLAQDHSPRGRPLLYGLAVSVTGIPRSARYGEASPRRLKRAVDVSGHRHGVPARRKPLITTSEPMPASARMVPKSRKDDECHAASAEKATPIGHRREPRPGHRDAWCRFGGGDRAAAAERQRSEFDDIRTWRGGGRRRRRTTDVAAGTASGHDDIDTVRRLRPGNRGSSGADSPSLQIDETSTPHRRIGVSGLRRRDVLRRDLRQQTAGRAQHLGADRPCRGRSAHGGR